MFKKKRNKRKYLTKLRRTPCSKCTLLFISSEEGRSFVWILLREAKHLNNLKETYLGYFLNNKQQRTMYFRK